jgi:hypothetical protein
MAFLQAPPARFRDSRLERRRMLKRFPNWLIPITIALVLLVGNLASNLAANYITEEVKPYDTGCGW